MIDERTLEELIKIGRSNGRITTEDVQRLVPIGLVPLEELASLILRLEEAGIEVDLDPALLQPGPGRPVPLRPVTTDTHTDPLGCRSTTFRSDASSRAAGAIPATA